MKEYKEKIQMINDTDKYESFITPEEDFQYCLNSERELGLEEGLTQGENQEKIKMAYKLKDKNYSIEETAELTELPINTLKEIFN